jgi:TRAP-type C4-dicarboxylate transport system permease small subunit
MIEQVWLIAAAVSLGIAIVGGWRALAMLAVALIILCLAGFVVAPTDIHPDYWSFEKGWDHVPGISAMYIVLVGPSAFGAGGIGGLALRSLARHVRNVMGKQEQDQ